MLGLLENKSKESHEVTVTNGKATVAKNKFNIAKLDLYNELNKAGYLCDKKFANKVKTSIKTQPTAGAFLFGPAGSGKSYLPEVLAKILDCNLLFYQCFPGTREEDLIVKILPAEDTVSGVRLCDGVITQAVNNTQNPEGYTILVLDEWDKTRPSADSFLLRFLQDGHINYMGYEGKIDTSKFIIFLTMNDERELSEPLMRRLPKIDFRPLTPDQIKEALENTHPRSEYVRAATVLYTRCLLAELTKPCTLQELRQLLDALETLSEREADWDDLVYQFITKTPENHTKLKQSENTPIESVKQFLDRQGYQPLDANDYEATDSQMGITKRVKKNPETRLPNRHLAEAKELTKEVPSIKDVNLDLKQSCGVVLLSDENYNEVVKLVKKPNNTPSLLGTLVQVLDGDGTLAPEGYKVLNFIKPLYLTEAHLIKELWRQEGEVMFIEPRATHDEIRRLQDKCPQFKICSYSDKEILARTQGMDARWTPKEGLEVIFDLQNFETFLEIFCNHHNPTNADPTATQFQATNHWKHELTQRGYKDYHRRARTETGRKNYYIGKDSNDTNLYACIEVNPIKQQSPETGDSMIVEIRFELPMHGDGFLHPELTFGKRLVMFEQHLEKEWGQSLKKTSSRYVKKNVQGKTQREALIWANIYAHEELIKLIISLRRRRHATK